MNLETSHSRAVFEQLQEAAIYWENDLNRFDFVLLLVDDDECFNSRVQKAFESRLNSRSGKIVCGEQANTLLTIYTLYSFTDKLIIGSFDKPYGRKLNNLVISGIATEDEVINDVLLGML